MATTKVTNDMLVGPLGSGGGSINLIENGDADGASATIFTAYKDVGSRPTDGTGGVPAVSSSITTTNPLTGTKSYLLTKPAAASHQGEGWSLPSTPLDPSYRAKSLKISFDYIVEAGTFVAGLTTTDGDIIWTCYDETNLKIVEPSNIKMFASSTTITDKFQATVQFDSNCTSFRLLGHIASASTQLIQIKVDNITVSPSEYIYGTPITDWVSWTPTGSWTTNTTYTGKKRRVGDEYEYLVKVSTSGAPNVAALTINLQETIDTTKLNSTIQYASAFESAGNAYDSGNGYPVKVAYTTTTSVVLLTNGSPEAVVGPTAPFTFGAGDEINVRFTLPILGKSSSVQMSDSAETRLVAVQLGGAAVATTAQTPIIFPTAANDTHGSYNATTGRYLVQSAGYYRVTLYSVGGTIAAGQFAYASVNAAAPAGTNSPRLGNAVNANDPLIGTGVVFAKSGDFIDIRPNVNYGALNAVSTASITKIQGPQAIAATESINAVYKTAAGQSIPNATDTIIDFGTAEINSHGNVTTGAAWKFTAQISGVYEVSTFVQLNSGGGWNISEEVVVSIFKNGSGLATIGLYAETVVNSVAVSIPCAPRQFRLLAGEYIDIRINQNSGAALSLVAADVRNWISIKKVGN